MHGSTSPLEERLAGVLPAAVLSDQRHRSADPVIVRVDAEILQQHEAVGAWRSTAGPGSRSQGSGRPSRAGKQAPPAQWPSSPCSARSPRAPALGGHPRALRRDDLSAARRAGPATPASGSTGRNRAASRAPSRAESSNWRKAVRRGGRSWSRGAWTGGRIHGLRTGPDARVVDVRLTAGQLNRATLGRQLLLRRESLDVADAVRRVVALQAQDPASPYLALWNRVQALRSGRSRPGVRRARGRQGSTHADHAARGRSRPTTARTTTR